MSEHLIVMLDEFYKSSLDYVLYFLWGTLLLSLIRFSFLAATEISPHPGRIHVLPMIPMIGDDDFPWPMILMFNCVGYGILAIPFTLGWPVAVPLYMLYVAVQGSRLKRFGKSSGCW